MTSDDLKAVIERGETANIDFKGPLEWEGDHKVELTRDIAAMANTRDGGLIIVGVEEEPETKRPRIVGLNDTQLASFDPSRIGQYVNSRFEPPVELRVEKPTVDGKALAVIQVSEFRDSPAICTKEGRKSGNREIFMPGAVLVRTGAAETRQVDAEHMRELVGRAITRRGDHLLDQIRRIVTGAPAIASPGWEGEFVKELEEWADEEEKFRRASAGVGTWSLFVVPTSMPPQAPLVHGELKKAILAAIVSLRGWSFPYHRPEGIRNLQSGISHDIDSHLGDKEHWNFFRRLVFGFARTMWEDRKQVPLAGHGPGKVLSFVNVTYTVAEYVLFTKRVFEAVGYEGALLIRISLHGCRGRSLVSTDSDRRIDEHICDEDSPKVELSCHTTSLAAGWEEIVAGLVAELFALFNWSDPDRSMILGDIYKLRDRKI